LQSLLLIVGINTRTSVWNLIVDQFSEVLTDAASWQPRAQTRTSNSVADFVATTEALALTQTAEDACARIVEVWRDACRCAADVMEILLVTYRTESKDVQLPGT
jgi:hypothetical protein